MNKYLIDVEVCFVFFNKILVEEYGYKDDEFKNFNINCKILLLFYGYNEFFIVVVLRYIKGDFCEFFKKKYFC